MGKHEVVKLRGLHPLIRMHIARRGWRKSDEKIAPPILVGLFMDCGIPLLNNAIDMSQKYRHLGGSGKPKRAA